MRCSRFITLALLTSALCVRVGLSPLSAHAESDPSLRLGVVAPLTGDFASYGEELRRGVDMAVDVIQRRASTLSPPIRIFYQDACLPAPAVAAAHKLIEVDRIDGIAGSYCVIGMIPMMDLFERHKIPSFHTSAVPRALSQSGRYLFTTNVAVDDEGKAAATFARNVLRAQRPAVFYITSQWGEDYASAFLNGMTDLNDDAKLRVEASKWSGDFRAELTRIRQHNPDLLFIAHIGSEFGSIARQARALGITAQIMGPHEAKDESAVGASAGALEGSVLLSPEPQRDDPVAAEFRRAFQERYHQEPGVLASNAYDATILLVHALRSCHKEPTCTREKLLSGEAHRGASGTFTLLAGHGSRKAFRPITVRQGRYIPFD